ncbi:MAG TPA: GGDEF domain-containing protein [Burkholderiaceae bacterium]|nr:GGDEF domain-containing protein [Burkholderiaceae bacterium]
MTHSFRALCLIASLVRIANVRGAGLLLALGVCLGPAGAQSGADYEARLVFAERQADRHPRAAAKLLDALQATPPPDERSRLRIAVARLLISASLNAPAETQQRAEALLPALEAFGDQRMLAVALLLLGYAVDMQGGAAQALEFNRRAIDLAAAAGARDVEIEALSDRSSMLRTTGRFDEMFAVVERVTRLAHEFPGYNNEAYAAYAQARAARLLGDRAQQIDAMRRAVEAFRTADVPSGLADTLIGLALALQLDKRAAEALPLLDQSVRLFESLDDERGIAIAEAPRSVALAELGRAADAIAASDRALRILATHTDSEELLSARLDRAQMANLLGRPQMALAALEAARPQIERDKDPSAQRRFAQESAAALSAVGRFREAYAAGVALREYDERNTQVRLARQLAAQRGQLAAERLLRDNEALRREAEASRRAVAALERESRLQAALAVLGGIIVAAALLGLWWQRRINQRVAVLATTDDLTGALNRRRIVEIGKEAFGTFRQLGTPIAVVVVDLDHFKHINDRYGHAVGDAALRLVADTLRKELRDTDRLGRYGGEEFAIILPRTDAQDAVAVAERVRAAIAALANDSLGIDGRLTLSVGVAVAAANDADFDAVFVRADQALYRAKENGRNRVELSLA